MYVTYREGHSSEGKNLVHAKEGMEDLVLYVNDILEDFPQRIKPWKKNERFLKRSFGKEQRFKAVQC